MRRLGVTVWDVHTGDGPEEGDVPVGAVGVLAGMAIPGRGVLGLRGVNNPVLSLS